MPVIIAGRRRGAKLCVPEGLGVRPTLVRVREALFSILTSELGTFENCQVFDPFAGAGALGLEAWSRGAQHIDFMEQSRAHFTCLLKNIASLHAQDQVCAKQGQSPRDWRLFNDRRYDLVLCDPPYSEGLMPEILRALIQGNRLNPAALVSVELSATDTLQSPEQFTLLKERVYGKCKIALFQAP